MYVFMLCIYLVISVTQVRGFPHIHSPVDMYAGFSILMKKGGDSIDFFKHTFS